LLTIVPGASVAGFVTACDSITANLLPTGVVMVNGAPPDKVTVPVHFDAAILILVFLSVAGLCHLFGGTMGGVRAGQRSRRYWWQLGEGESEQQVVP
jgi:hypothetical protein